MASIWRKNALVGMEVAAEAVLGAVYAALPASWRKNFGAARWLVLAPGEARHLAPNELRPTAIALPADEILLRELDLPLTSRFQLARLMRYEVLLHVPLPLDQARLDFRILRRDLAASRMRVELAVMRAEVVTAALALFSEQKPDAVAISAEDGLWLARRPLGQDLWRAWLNRRHARLLARWAVPAVLAVLFVAGVQNWAARLEAKRDAELVLAHRAAAGIQPVRQQLSLLNAKLIFLADLRRRPSAGAVSEEVTRLLPDDAWAEELDIDAGNVHLRGTAKDATNLLRILSDSAMFTNVAFGAPLTQAPGADGENFDIVMALR